MEEDAKTGTKRKAEESPAAPAEEIKRPKVETPTENVEAQVFKILINGMPYQTTESEIREFFSNKCTEIVVEANQGSAIVSFASQADKDEAMKLDNEYIGSRYVRIRSYTSGGSHSGGVRPEGCNTLFLGNLSFNIDEETIRQTFAECGEIAQVRWGMDRETGDFKGFAFVEFVDPASTEAGYKLAGSFVMGRPMKVDYTKPRAPRNFDNKGKGGFNKRSPAGGRGGFNKRSPAGGAPRRQSTNVQAFKGNKVTFD